jgi:D-amino-acid dehydrogenase
MDQVLRRTVTDGGWLAHEPESLDPSAAAWIRSFHGLPPWRAKIFTEDIHQFSKDSYPVWERLRHQEPHLFEGVGLTPGVLRLYSRDEKAAAAESLHSRLGSLVRSLDREELVRRHPACAAAVAAGHVSRALEIRGFTLNIHAFVNRLRDHLEAAGARFRWQERIESIEGADRGQVRGLRTERGEIIRSRHYVISPGAHAGSLLRGTRSHGKIQGIAGLWLTLPHLEPRLGQSLKIHREGHVGEDSNVTLGHDSQGRPVLWLGSGYGFLGCRSADTGAVDMASPQVRALFEALEETARRYFPGAYEAARRDGSLDRSRKACVRPFTSTGLGVFEVLRTDQGGRLVIASGHNTGGFAQSPAVAEAVAETLRGRPHAMQALYDPERGVEPEDLHIPNPSARPRLRPVRTGSPASHLALRGDP